MALQLSDLRILFRGQHLGKDLIDAQVLRDCVSHRPGIAGDHGDADAAPVQAIHRAARLGPDLVLDNNGAQHVMIIGHVEHG